MDKVPRENWLARLFGLDTAPAGTFVAERAVRPVPPAPIEVGQTVQGRHLYRLVRSLGEGSFGTVFLATADDLEIPVAIKVLSPRLQQTVRLASMRRELSSLLAFEHRNIPRVDDWQLDGAHPFVVMEYFAGGSLDALLAREGTLPDDRILPLFEALLGALAAAQRASVLHLDVKPANVLIREDHSYAIADFGTAQAALAESGVGGPSSRGSPGYQAPEQRSKAATVDHRADLYSVGATIWAALTGIDLGSQRGQRILSACVGQGATLPPVRQFRPLVSAEIERVLERVLQREPSD